MNYQQQLDLDTYCCGLIEDYDIRAQAVATETLRSELRREGEDLADCDLESALRHIFCDEHGFVCHEDFDALVSNVAEHSAVFGDARLLDLEACIYEAIEAANYVDNGWYRFCREELLRYYEENFDLMDHSPADIAAARARLEREEIFLCDSSEDAAVMECYLRDAWGVYS